MKIFFAVGTFACCNKAHVFAAGSGGRDALEAAMPAMIHHAEQEYGPCKTAMIADMDEDMFIHIAACHAVRDLAVQATSEAVVKEQLEKHR